MKNDRDERTRPHVPTSPEECDPNSAAVQRWQPKRLPLREGIAQASWFCRIMYILIVLGTGALNLIYWQKLPIHWSCGPGSGIPPWRFPPFPTLSCHFSSSAIWYTAIW